jgi:hypothetical protein
MNVAEKLNFKRKNSFKNLILVSYFLDNYYLEQGHDVKAVFCLAFPTAWPYARLCSARLE